MNLFKIDSKKKIRVLDIWAQDDKLIRLAGIYQGNLVETGKVCKGKNIGRANETTPTEQAELEAQSEITKKIREGYIHIENFKKLTDDDIRAYILENSIPIPTVMLAKDYADRYVKWGVDTMMHSDKLDGMRCTAVIKPGEVKLYSRGRKPIEIMRHIEDELLKMQSMSGFEGTLDGELYYHDRDADNFQDVMKACKKYRQGITERVEYHVYELIDEDRDAMKRYEHLKWLLGTHIESFRGNTKVKLHKQTYVNSFAHAKELHSLAISNGFEGSILKHATGMYRQGARSNQLLKFKDFNEAEFAVLDIVPMDAYPKQGKVWVDAGNGKTFKVTPKLSHSQREKLLLTKDKWIGGAATVRYFGLTDAGLPRIASLKYITIDGDLEDFRVTIKKNV